MSISTVFLQTTEDNSNSFADTTFHIDLPMLQPTYKLSVATFMFRPAIILGENQYIKVRFTLDRDGSNALTFPNTLDHRFNDGEWGKWDVPIEAILDVGTLQYQSGFDDATLTELCTKKIQFTTTRRIIAWNELAEGDRVPENDAEHTYVSVTKDNKTWYYDEKVVTHIDTKLTIEFAFRWTAKNRLEMFALKPLKYHDNTNRCYWNLTSFEITDISSALSHLTGITANIPFIAASEKVIDVSVQVFKATMLKPFNPQYWNYITLTCNKVYNTATIVNQTHYNVQPNEATQFYKCQIMGYMINQSPTQTYITTGVPTSNDYLITPSDFNSIRFNLHFDNGEPVQLYSPMTIVLNITPV